MVSPELYFTIASPTGSSSLPSYPGFCVVLQLFLFSIYSSVLVGRAGRYSKHSCLRLLLNWLASRLSQQLAPAPTMLFNGLFFSIHVKISFTYTRAALCTAVLSGSCLRERKVTPAEPREASFPLCIFLCWRKALCCEVLLQHRPKYA